MASRRRLSGGGAWQAELFDAMRTLRDILTRAEQSNVTAEAQTGAGPEAGDWPVEGADGPAGDGGPAGMLERAVAMMSAAMDAVDADNASDVEVRTRAHTKAHARARSPPFIGTRPTTSRRACASPSPPRHRPCVLQDRTRAPASRGRACFEAPRSLVWWPTAYGLGTIGPMVYGLVAAAPCRARAAVCSRRPTRVYVCVVLPQRTRKHTNTNR
jgi:hypothetical protein